MAKYQSHIVTLTQPAHERCRMLCYAAASVDVRQPLKDLNTLGVRKADNFGLRIGLA